MSVENRIFWLVVGVLAFYLVFVNTGRGAVQRFIYGVFGYGSAAGSGTGATSPAPAPANKGTTGDGPSSPSDPAWQLPATT